MKASGLKTSECSEIHNNLQYLQSSLFLYESTLMFNNQKSTEVKFNKMLIYQDTTEIFV